ncbi:hypothetical protein [Limnoglobus roseus]|uniref:Uncharacterized protein n=1 Tax=Limnoglobus roseus TaxID=2598579 RepID=A0A5C1A5N2_9BACT|nr:hypothetical protein [Limnoglobus roseus]QEL14459.1 hypothetical protein PX52LOC_01347 [Limnoglobus roseus]
MQLREALTQIAEIRSAVAATEQFRGYRAVPVAFSGGLAILAAAVQPLLLPSPGDDLRGYLLLWFSVAILGLGAAGLRIVKRDWFAASVMRRELTRHAVAQFAPCLAAGLLVTVAIARHSADAAWILPGVWQVVFSLGVFASWRLLPKPTVWVGVFYLLAGTYNLAFSHGPAAFDPWAMGGPFGLGQLAVAAILYWNLERTDG